MSNNNDTFKRFAFVVDGVVAQVLSISDTPEWEAFIALHSSKPIVIEVPSELQNFGEGYLWDGTSFNPPV